MDGVAYKALKDEYVAVSLEAATAPILQDPQWVSADDFDALCFDERVARVLVKKRRLCVATFPLILWDDKTPHGPCPFIVRVGARTEDLSVKNLAASEKTSHQHPHVNMNSPCLGDHVIAVNLWLTQGRLAKVALRVIDILEVVGDSRYCDPWYWPIMKPEEVEACLAMRR